MTPPPGYTVVRELGRGRLGATSLCRDLAGTEVVVTALEVRLSKGRARSELESELGAAAAAFDHPCAVGARVAGEGEDLWLLQPYFAGGALGSSSLAPDVVVVGGVRLAAVLAHAHATGMLHGDLRPSNVLRSSDGQWLLAMGGVAHAVGRAGSDIGAQPDPLFAAPEYFNGEQPGAAADVYSLGATLYAVLVGQAPHAEVAHDGVGALYAARLGPPPELPLSVPAPLAAVIARMLAADPAERPALSEVDQVLRSLAAAGATLPPGVWARAVSPAPRPAVRIATTEPEVAAAASKRRTLAAAAAIGAVFVVAAGVVAATNGGDGAELVAASGPTPSPSPAVTTPAEPVRGTTGQAAGAGVTQGYVPARIAVFEYRGQLAVIWTMATTAKTVTNFKVYAAEADGSGREDELPGKGLAIDKRVYFFVFGPKVPLSKCVQIEPVVKRGSPTPAGDNRNVCVGPLTEDDRKLADEGWRLLQDRDKSRATGKPRST